MIVFLIALTVLILLSLAVSIGILYDSIKYPKKQPKG